MGLTGGIADVGSLYDCLVGIHTGQADDSILDKYDEVRRKIWYDIIDPVSSANIRRLFYQDPDEALEKDPFLKMLKQAETDAEAKAKLQKVSDTPELPRRKALTVAKTGFLSLTHDMTQYYTKQNSDKEAAIS